MDLEERMARLEALQGAHEERHARIDLRLHDKLEHLDDHLDRMEAEQNRRGLMLTAIATKLNAHTEPRKFRMPTKSEGGLLAALLTALIYGLIDFLNGGI